MIFEWATGGKCRGNRKIPGVGDNPRPLHLLGCVAREERKSKTMWGVIGELLGRELARAPKLVQEFENGETRTTRMVRWKLAWPPAVRWADKTPASKSRKRLSIFLVPASTKARHSIVEPVIPPHFPKVVVYERQR